MAEKTISLGNVDGGVDFYAMSGTMGPDVIDIRKLYGATDQFTYDPGFTSTASCESALTYIDEVHAVGRVPCKGDFLALGAQQRRKRLASALHPRGAGAPAIVTGPN